MRQIKTYAQDTRANRPDSRQVAVFRCNADAGSKPNTEILRSIEVEFRIGLRKSRIYKTPEEFWADMEQKAPMVLLCGSPARDMALVGSPPGRTAKSLESLSPQAPYRTLFKDGKAQIEVIGIPNLHPDGPYAYTLSVEELTEWAWGYLQFLEDFDLGPLKYTHGLQALYGLKMVNKDHNTKDLLHYHLDPEVTLLERRGQAGPLRFTKEGLYGNLIKADFKSFYPSILLNQRLPRKAAWHFKDGCSKDLLRQLLDQEFLVIADVVVEGEQKVYPTPLLNIDTIDTVNEIAVYRPTNPNEGPLKDWVEKMWEVRLKADDVHKASAKQITNSLWGKMYQRAGRVSSVETEDMSFAVGHVWNPGGARTFWQYEDDVLMRYEEDLSAVRRDSMVALGQHVMGHGRVLTSSLVDENTVHSHTDSVWQLPVDNSGTYPQFLERDDIEVGNGEIGSLDIELKEGPCKFTGGAIEVGGKVEVNIGVPREGWRSYITGGILHGMHEPRPPCDAVFKVH